MSKIRMALLKNCDAIGVVWFDQNGIQQGIKIKLPQRKRITLMNALKTAMEFPEPKVEKQVVDEIMTKTEGGLVVKKPSIILPASMVEQPAQQAFRPRQPGEIRLDD